MTDASQLPLPRRVEKENLAAFIAKKREIFMVQMSLDIKRQEMQRLAQQAAQVIRPTDPLPVPSYGGTGATPAVCPSAPSEV